ncbi:MAG: hypothetical protein KatS3mg102_2329 [Planctomycetota bacterium]|nr:MAG: hypothetical protein KatS3mg102_2329 [Planctomycetota bacterium]
MIADRERDGFRPRSAVRHAAAVLGALVLLPAPVHAQQAPAPAARGEVRPGERLDRLELPALGGGQLVWEPAAGTLVLPGQPPQQPRAVLLHVFQPDCPKCQELARALELLRAEERAGLVVFGIAYRADAAAAAAFARASGAHYPIALGTGSEWARRWSGGDPLYLAGPDGAIAYAQVGFRHDDPALWREAVRAVLAGRAPARRTAERERVLAGDPLPEIALPALEGQALLRLRRLPDGTLALLGAGPAPRRARASVGFFSRY